MIIPYFLKGKSIVIMGLGLTGRSAFSVLKKVTDKIVLVDDFIDKIDLKDDEKKYVKDPVKIDFKTVDYLFLSPGINIENHQIVKKAKQHKVEIISDIDMLDQSKKDAFFIAVTGTNGKTTTASMIYHAILKITNEVGFCGNNGNPCLMTKPSYKIYVIEISSFQINLLTKFRANIGILLNIENDHLDVYKTGIRYAKVKAKLKSDTLICNMDFEYFDKIISDMVYDKKILLSSNKNKGADFVIDHNSLVCKNNSVKMPNIETNKMNIAMAMLCISIINDGIENATQIWEDFKTLSHRREVFTSYKKTTFINDSKATNIAATVDAVMQYKNIHLVIGGIMKEKSFTKFLTMKVKSKVDKIYIYGRDRDIMAQHLAGHFNVQKHRDISEVVNAFFCEKACGDDIVFLLSPMAASFDQFKNYGERGNHFMDLVLERIYERENRKMVAGIR